MKKTRPKEEYDTRDIIEKFRVSKEEAKLIENKFRNSGYKSKSDFFRIMIADRFIDTLRTSAPEYGEGAF